MSAIETAKLSSEIKTFHYSNDRQIAAPIDVVFETVVHSVGPLADMKLKMEAWPGGRWFRDLGDNAGHLWGHVQVIKPPKLLELCGPMMMSYAATSFVQYRLTEENGATRLMLTHQAMGMIKPEHMEGFSKGWTAVLDDAKARAEAAAKR
jgi:uncharacterized protein YndB with AHSA1/START domain